MYFVYGLRSHYHGFSEVDTIILFHAVRQELENTTSRQLPNVIGILL